METIITKPMSALRDDMVILRTRLLDARNRCITARSRKQKQALEDLVAAASDLVDPILCSQMYTALECTYNKQGVTDADYETRSQTRNRLCNDLIQIEKILDDSDGRDRKDRLVRQVGKLITDQGSLAKTLEIFRRYYAPTDTVTVTELWSETTPEPGAIGHPVYLIPSRAA